MTNEERQYLNRHSKNEKRFARVFYRALRQQILSYPNLNLEPIQKAYERLYLDVMRTEGLITWNKEVKPILGVQVKDLTDDLAQIGTPSNPEELPSFWQLLMGEYLKLYLGFRINEVSNTTLKRINDLGLSPDLTPQELKRALQAHARTQELRANTIARTETTNAMMKAQMLVLESSGLQWEKAWVAIRDDRTRDAHWNTDPTQFIPLRMAFNVGGQALGYPGDLTLGATAGNVINCRCMLKFRQVGARFGFRPVRRN